MTNETIQNIITRRSVKKYKSEMLPNEIIDEIINAGIYAPSGRNKQPAIILGITNKKIRDEMARLNAKVMGLNDFDPFYGAPVILVVLADKSSQTAIYDGSLVMGNLLLAAHSLNVGSCWIHRAKEVFETKEGKEILKMAGIDGDYEGIGICILGYSDIELTEPLPRREKRIYKI